MTVIGRVSLVVGLHAVANAEHPDVAEEEPNEEKHAQGALHAASEGNGADHQAVNGFFSLEHRPAEVASGREQKEDDDAQTTATRDDHVQGNVLVHGTFFNVENTQDEFSDGQGERTGQVDENGDGTEATGGERGE